MKKISIILLLMASSSFADSTFVLEIKESEESCDSLITVVGTWEKPETLGWDWKKGLSCYKGASEHYFLVVEELVTQIEKEFTMGVNIMESHEAWLNHVKAWCEPPSTSNKDMVYHYNCNLEQITFYISNLQSRFCYVDGCPERK